MRSGLASSANWTFLTTKSSVGLGPSAFPILRQLGIPTLDAKMTWLLWERYKRQLAYEEIEHIFEMEMDLLGVVMRMEQKGTPLNRAKLIELDRELEKEQAELQTFLEKANGGPINLNANRQVAELVYDKRGHRCKSTTATGQRSVNKAALAAFAKDRVVESLLRYSEIQKLRSSFTQSLLDQVGREGPAFPFVHPQFIQVGPVTGRMACRKPNLQQQPARSALGKRVRECFEAPPGYALIVADYSQIELRILAHYTRDKTLRQAYTEGLDLHTLTAKRAFHTETPTPAQRSLAKNVNFSVVYQGGPYTLQSRYGIPLHEAERIIETFYRTYSRVRPWTKEVVRAWQADLPQRPLHPPLCDHSFRPKAAFARDLLE